MSISLTAIHENGHNVRRLPAGRQADQALEDSIRAQGVLVPILVRPQDGGYILIAGHRRVAAARAVGLSEIPALVMDGLVNGHATAAQAAENLVRAPMHPVDRWRAIVQLQNDGFTLPAAAAALGMNERFARRLDKLGRLHPDVLKLIEEFGLPDERYLSVIAMAAPETQRKALKAKDAVGKDWNDGAPSVRWNIVAAACTTRRFSRRDAIFDVDTAKIAWDEDLFAEPGSEEQFTTTNTKAFLAAQQAALEASVAERAANKERVQLTTYGENGLTLPTAWKRTYREGKPKADEAIFCAVRPDGTIAYECAVDTKAQAEREKKRAEREREKAKAERKAAKSGAPAETDANPDDEDAGEEEAEITAAPKLPITKAGIAAIAAAKTDALRAHLRSEQTAQRSHEDMLRLMILLLGSRNIQIQGGDIDWETRHFEDLVARLLLPGGQIDPHTGPTLPGIAGELIARIVSAKPEGMMGSGQPAEWIGAAIGADEALPRFDTAEFLAHVNGDELRRAALAEDIKPPAKVSAMREQLVGKLPNWKPAVFGAPAPVVEKEHFP
jgi:ParB family chromosome partitioning protein